MPVSTSPSNLDFSVSLRVCSVNINGVNVAARERRLKLAKLDRLVSDCDANVLLLQETHQTSSNDSLHSNDSFCFFRSDCPTSCTKGVAVGLRRDLLDPMYEPSVLYKDDNGRALFVRFRDVHNKTHTVASLYFPAESAADRCDFIDTLPDSVVSNTDIIGLDSNLHTRPDDSSSRRVGNDGRKFVEWLERCGLVDSFDLFFENELPPRTYNNSSCIDRILLSSRLAKFAQSCCVEAFNPTDHAAVFVHILAGSTSQRAWVPARVPTEYLIIDEVRTNAVRAANCASAQHVVPKEKLAASIAAASDVLFQHRTACRKITRCLSRQCCKRIKKNIKRKQRRTLDVAERKALTESFTNAERNADLVVQRRFEQKTDQRSVDLQQLSRAYSTRVRPTIASVVLDDGTVSQDDSVVAAQHTKQWRDIFNRAPIGTSSECKAARHMVLDCVQPVDGAGAINADLTLSDLERAVSLMKDNTPGIDRCSLLLYQSVPPLIKLILDVWNARHRDGLPDEWKQAMISLLHKSGPLSSPTNFRPISLLCVGYKIIAKAISLRLREVLPVAVNGEQKAFVIGRHIQSAVASILGAADHARRTKSNLAVVSFDVSKAYDTLQRDYVFDVLEKMGFLPQFVDDLRLLHTDITAQLVINGRLCESFPIQTGVRQGDALSCALYVLAMSPIFELARRQGVVGYAVPDSDNSTINLMGAQFVDDLTAFLSAKNDGVLWVNVWKVFSSATGQLCNLEPSEGPVKTAAFIANGKVDSFDLPLVLRNCIVPRNKHHRVLGFLLDHACRIHDDTWSRAIAMATARCVRWSHMGLQLVEKGILINTHVLAQVLYIASVVPMPSHVATALNTLVFRTFLYNNAPFCAPFEISAGPRVLGGVLNNPIGLVEDTAAAALAMMALRVHAGASHDIDKWLWYDAGQQLADLCGAAQSVVNGLPPRTLSGNPLAMSQAAFAACQPVCQRWRRARSRGTALPAQLFLNPLIDPEMKASFSHLTANVATVSDLLGLASKSSSIPLRRLIEADADFGLLSAARSQPDGGDFSVHSLAAQRFDEPMGQGARLVSYQVGVVVALSPKQPATALLHMIPDAQLDEPFSASWIEAASKDPMTAKVSSLITLFPVFVDSRGILRLRASEEFCPSNVTLPCDNSWIPFVETARACIRAAVAAGLNINNAKRRRFIRRLRLRIDHNMLGARDILPETAVQLLTKRKQVTLNRVTRMMLKKRLHALRLSSHTLDLQQRLPVDMNRVFKSVPLSLTNQSFLMKLNIGRLPFGPRCGMLGRTMLVCTACQMPIADLANDHTSRDCVVALALLDLLCPWFNELTFGRGARCLQLAWYHTLRPAARSSLSVVCFLLSVIAKRCLHNAATIAFAKQREVASVSVIFAMVRSLFIGRVLSARKSIEEFQSFMARSMAVLRFVGPRPVLMRKNPAHWLSCLDNAAFGRASAEHWSAAVPCLDPIDSAITNMVGARS
jgi:hypothetical protein